MRGLPYYEEEAYHQYLLSPERKEIFPPDKILGQINWSGVQHILDFGMGNGYFLPYFKKHLDKDIQIWGAECQEILIDETLHLKVKENFTNFIPFFLEKNEHPLLPEWLPQMDIVFCSCVLSTFADPTLAIKGIGRIMKEGGRMILLDWDKVEAPSGPDITQKVSRDRMSFFIEEADYKIVHTLEINKYFYGFEIMPATGESSKVP